MADSDSDDEFEFGTTVVDAGATSLKVNVLGQSFTLSQQLEPKDLAPLFSDEWTGNVIERNRTYRAITHLYCRFAGLEL